MSLSALKKTLACLSFFACTPLFAAPIVVDVAGIKSYGLLGNPGNTVLTYQVGANASITNVSYDVNVAAFGPSWLSELSVAFSNMTVTRGFALEPGFNDQHPGTAAYTGALDLRDLGLNFDVGADGLLRLEFFDSVDDNAVAPDGQWNLGTITISYEAGAAPPVDVPEPATALLLGAGLMMIGYGRRRAG